ncbi:TPA: rhamnan synthesis F family protein [Aeromonas sobria]|nr:rhamnan synthesis F family protein [Aeromonas sobria]
MKRIAFYLFYDKDGVVDQYIQFKLSELKKSVEKIVVVSNSPLTNLGRETLENIGCDVLCRENIGFDVWGYKEGMEYIGQDKLSQYDELIMLNYTFFGPIFPFEEMFSWAEQQPQLGFWGLSDHAEKTPNPFTGTGTLHRHIQSHFIAVRKKLFQSPEFIAYWKNMPMINSYQDSILNHESKFTHYFEQRGFSYAVYISTEDYQSEYPTFFEVAEVLKNRCPIIKRRPFFHEPLWLDKCSIDLPAALQIAKEQSNYDLNFIYQNLARTTKPKDLASNLELLKVFSTEGDVPFDCNVKIAVIAHVYYPDMLQEIITYANNIPAAYDLYISTGSLQSKLEIEREIENIPNSAKNIEVRVVEYNRGRDISSLLLTMRDVILKQDYEFILRLHSKKSPQNDARQAEHFKQQMYDNLVASRGYVSRLLSFMQENPQVGFLCPSMVHIGYPTLGHAWFSNKPGAEALAKRLGIKVPFDEISPFAAYGTMFWFRPDALKRLFEENWRWDEFSAEPAHYDGSLAHLIERLLVYTVHNAGYIAYNIMSTMMAEKNYAKLEYKMNRVMACLHNGDVQWQVYDMQLPRQNGEPPSSVKRNFKILIRSIGRSITFRYPRLATLLKKPYFLIFGH